MRNSSAGLIAEVEGPSTAVEAFVRCVTSEPPPLAWVRETEVLELPILVQKIFAIDESISRAGESSLVSPDVATCDACSNDIADPRNRRFGYSFTNCTHCGPRYTIVRDIPYDRANTTMAAFAPCAECGAEYNDPTDRRFHAQPNACPDCGPSLSAPVEEARRRLAAGQILAIKGLGGFHLACDARQEDSVSLLRRRKKRSDKPFALMCRDMASVEEICAPSDADRMALLSPARPIVVMPRREGADFHRKCRTSESFV